MGKANIKSGAKLDLTAPVNGEEMDFKSSFSKEAAGKWQISLPMANGKSHQLAPGTPVAISWLVDESRYSATGTVEGSVKQGVRTYLSVRVDEDIQKAERRAFIRISAELDVELISYNTDEAGVRTGQSYKGKTTDISNGGAAVLTSAPLATGEIINCTIARRGVKKLPLRAQVCWTRPAPRGMGYKDSVGLQFLFANNEEGIEVSKLTAALAAKK